MLTLTVNATGKTFDDLVMAIDQIRGDLNSECWAGMDGNDDGEYTFDVTGEDESDLDEEEDDDE